MKNIAITQNLSCENRYLETREMLDINYSKLLHEAEFMPIILPYEINFKEYFKLFKIDGVFLSGGNDLYSCNENALSFKRDMYEKNLISFCINQNIPIFGICRGMQIIAEFFGSTLRKVDNQVAIKEKLQINQKSKYAKYLNNLKNVNSFHNYAIDTISQDLLICATNEQGIIKAIEHKNYKIFAQMWHSERENPFSRAEISLMKAVL